MSLIAGTASINQSINPSAAAEIHDKRSSEIDVVHSFV